MGKDIQDDFVYLERVMHILSMEWAFRVLECLKGRQWTIPSP